MIKRTSNYILLVLFTLLSCKESIIHDLSEKDIYKISAHLNQSGIESSRLRQGDGKWSLQVESQQASKAIDLIESSRILRERRDIQADMSVLPSVNEERQRYERSLGNALEDSLLTLGGVEEAKVHIQLSSKSPLSFVVEKNRNEDSASVLLLVSKPDSVSTEEVSKLVSGGTGISLDRVSVVIKNIETSNSQPISLVQSASTTVSTSIPIYISAGMIAIGTFVLWSYRYGKYSSSQKG